MSNIIAAGIIAVGLIISAVIVTHNPIVVSGQIGVWPAFRPTPEH